MGMDCEWRTAWRQLEFFSADGSMSIDRIVPAPHIQSQEIGFPDVVQINQKYFNYLSSDTLLVDNKENNVLLFPSSLPFLTVSCQEDPPYNLSQIPVQEEATPTEAPLEKPPPPGTNQKSVYHRMETELEITLDDKVIPDLTLPPEAKSQQIILDFIDPSVGNVLYGIVCVVIN